MEQLNESETTITQQRLGGQYNYNTAQHQHKRLLV